MGGTNTFACTFAECGRDPGHRSGARLTMATTVAALDMQFPPRSAMTADGQAARCRFPSLREQHPTPTQFADQRRRSSLDRICHVAEPLRRVQRPPWRACDERSRKSHGIARRDPHDRRRAASTRHHRDMRLPLPSQSTARSNRRRAPTAAALFLVAATCVLATTAAAAEPPVIAPPGIGTVNNDAMTVRGCRERLALPKASRPKDDDPRVDLDAVCRNILDSVRPKAAKPPASAARPASASPR